MKAELVTADSLTTKDTLIRFGLRLAVIKVEAGTHPIGGAVINVLHQAGGVAYKPDAQVLVVQRQS